MNTPLEATPPRTAAGSKALQAGEAKIRLLAGTHTGAEFGAIDYHIPPGFAPPPVLHRHTLEDAGWLVLEGDIRFTYEDGTEFLAGPGASTAGLLRVAAAAEPRASSIGKVAQP